MVHATQQAGRVHQEQWISRDTTYPREDSKDSNNGNHCTLRSAPTDLIDAHAGLLPMGLALTKACHRALVRTLTLPDTHPLHQIIRRAKRYPPEKHLSPLDQLLKIFKMRNTKLETIDSATHNMAGTARFTTTIAKSREDSITFERNDIADYKAFSDASAIL